MDKMREGFVKWFLDFYGKKIYFNESGQPSTSENGERELYAWSLVSGAAWLSWQAANKAAVPDGYCVVPVEPTDEMIKKAPKP